MLPAGFEPAIPASERPQTHALDRAVTHLMPYSETIAVCSENHTQYINVFCGKNVEIRTFKPGGQQRNH